MSSFRGQVAWVMHKSQGLHGGQGRNYVIEPEFIREIEQQHGLLNMAEILESGCKEEVQKAVEDVVPLAKHIGQEFGVVYSEPIPVTYPKDDV